MTDREKAIVMAYTGTCMLAGDKLGIYYQYIQEKLGHCVMTHELAYPEVQGAIREATKDDFIELCRASDEPHVLDFDEVVGGDECWFEAVNGACGYADCYACTGTGEVQIFRCKYDNPQYITASNYLKTWPVEWLRERYLDARDTSLSYSAGEVLEAWAEQEAK